MRGGMHGMQHARLRASCRVAAMVLLRSSEGGWGGGGLSYVWFPTANHVHVYASPCVLHASCTCELRLRVACEHI